MTQSAFGAKGAFVLGDAGFAQLYPSEQQLQQRQIRKSQEEHATHLPTPDTGAPSNIEKPRRESKTNTYVGLMFTNTRHVDVQSCEDRKRDFTNQI